VCRRELDDLSDSKGVQDDGDERPSVPSTRSSQASSVSSLSETELQDICFFHEKPPKLERALKDRERKLGRKVEHFTSGSSVGEVSFLLGASEYSVLGMCMLGCVRCAALACVWFCLFFFCLFRDILCSVVLSVHVRCVYLSLPSTISACV
jgi:hypothetical protein